MAMRPFVTTYGAIAFLAAGSESVRADPEVQGIAIASAVVVVASLLADMPQREAPRHKKVTARKMKGPASLQAFDCLVAGTRFRNWKQSDFGFG